MKNSAWYVSWVVVGLLACFGIGCKKAAVDPVVVEGASKLPGAAEAMMAIDKKDYEGAIAALAKIKEGLTTEEQNREFTVLVWQARTKLNEIAATDPKAAEAANALSALTLGVR